MRILRPILITVVVTFAVIFVGVSWVAPASLSFYAARKVPPVARVVPTDLNDTFVSQATGARLSYFGYEFEVPWSDLDDTQTKLYPADKPEKTVVFLTFRSGLRIKVTAIPAHECTRDSDPSTRMVPRVAAANFGTKQSGRTTVWPSPSMSSHRTECIIGRWNRGFTIANRPSS